MFCIVVRTYVYITEARSNEKRRLRRRRRRHTIKLFFTKPNRRAKRLYESRKSFDGFLQRPIVPMEEGKYIRVIFTVYLFA